MATSSRAAMRLLWHQIRPLCPFWNHVRVSFIFLYLHLVWVCKQITSVLKKTWE